VVLREQFLTPKPATEPNFTNTEINQRLGVLFNAATTPTCHKLHRMKPCDVDFRTWVRDFYDPDAQSGYESQYETEEDRQDRLGEYRLNYSDNSGAFSPGHGFDPNSSFGPNYPQ